MITGCIIAEGLRLGSSIEIPNLRLTRLVRKDVLTGPRADQPATWTEILFEADDAVSETLADALSAALLVENGWWADFSDGVQQVVVFAGKIFRYRRGDAEARQQAEAHGRSVGVPDHELDWPG